jgi:hypothetical protein
MNNSLIMLNYKIPAASNEKLCCCLQNTIWTKVPICPGSTNPGLKAGVSKSHINRALALIILFHVTGFNYTNLAVRISDHNFYIIFFE